MSGISTVAALYEAFGRGDVATILGMLREDVDWEHDAHDYGLPTMQHRRGRANVVGFFESLSVLDIRRFEVSNIMENAGQVVAVIHVEHVHKQTGKTFRDIELHLWTLDAEGKVAGFRHSLDTHQLWLQAQPNIMAYDDQPGRASLLDREPRH
ncbi:MAG TPA: nuclear transport factor 2 family protein [Polyangiales bacterium]